MILFGFVKMAVFQMRGLLLSSVKRDLAIGFTLSLSAGAAWWFGVVIPRRKRYDDFYRNYDAKAVAANMKASWEGVYVCVCAHLCVLFHVGEGTAISLY